MSAVHRTPTDREVRLQESYGTPFPDPLDLLVELVTARSGAGAVAISDRALAQRLRLKTTDDALRLVALAVKAGRVAVDRDGDRRLLAIPWGDQGTPPPVHPPAPEPPVVTEGPAMPVAPITADPKAGRRQGMVVHLNLPPEWHAMFKARADATGVSLNRVVVDAAITGFDGPARPVPADTAVPVAPVAHGPAIDDMDDLRVPVAMFRAARDAGITLRAMAEQLIAAGWASYQRAQAKEAGQ